MINPKIFKAYDIRGIYPEEVNEEAAEKIGAAFASYFDVEEVIVGRDARLSSPSLFKSLSKGIISQGKDVVDIGICTNPMLIFAVKTRKRSAGIMISASHNPPQYNAFKLNSPQGLQMTDGQYVPIKEMALDGFPKTKFPKGNKVSKDILPEYLSHILQHANEDIKKLKVAVDYGNGVGSISAKPFFRKVGMEAVSLYEEPDGRFPNHLADPHNLENMKELREKVVQEKADLGIFFDGDADRSFFIDEKGEIVMPDLLIALFAREELKNNPREKVYYDLRFSKVVKEVIEESGGEPIMMRVGNPFYKERMFLDGGILAGELSGHIFFKDNYGIDDGLFASIKIMNLLCQTKKPLSELIKPFKKYAASEEINLKVEDADKVMKSVAEHFKDGRSIDLDGVYIEFSDWWFNLRKSNTEPLVRLRVEANSQELLNAKREDLIGLLK